MLKDKINEYIGKMVEVYFEDYDYVIGKLKAFDEDYIQIDNQIHNIKFNNLVSIKILKKPEDD